eukprot:Opistho-2@71345
MATPMEHIDRNRLNEDILYRFQYLQKFMEFGANEIRALKAASPFIIAVAPAIVELVYRKLFAFDITKEVFLRRNEGYSGDLANDLASLDMNNGQIQYRKEALTKYLAKLVTSDYDENFVKYVDWVGKVHTPRSGSKNIAVEFVHIGSLCGYLSDCVLSAVQDLPLDPPTKKAVTRAFNKLFWIQADLFSRHYIPIGVDLSLAAKEAMANLRV